MEITEKISDEYSVIRNNNTGNITGVHATITMNWQTKTKEIANKRTDFINEPDLFFILKLIHKEKPKHSLNGIHYLSILNNCSEFLINQAIDQLIYLEYLTTSNNEFTITEKGINVLDIYTNYFMI